MARYFAEIAYNGNNYSGWQMQSNAFTLQEEISTCLKTLTKSEIPIVGCGRTDAGVHASQYFFHFDYSEVFDPIHLIFKLNKLSKKGIVFKRIFGVADDTHARFDAISRSYTYNIHFQKDPFLNELSWYFPYGEIKSTELLNESARLLLDYQDFQSFSKSNTDVTSFTCDIQHIQWKLKDHHLSFEISSNRFLRGMVRLIVGMCINVYRSKVSLEEVKTALENKSQVPRALSVPAHGLFLSRVEYSDF